MQSTFFFYFIQYLPFERVAPKDSYSIVAWRDDGGGRSLRPRSVNAALNDLWFLSAVGSLFPPVTFIFFRHHFLFCSIITTSGATATVTTGHPAVKKHEVISEYGIADCLVN